MNAVIINTMKTHHKICLTREKFADTVIMRPLTPSLNNISLPVDIRTTNSKLTLDFTASTAHQKCIKGLECISDAPGFIFAELNADHSLLSIKLPHHAQQ